MNTNIKTIKTQTSRVILLGLVMLLSFSAMVPAPQVEFPGPGDLFTAEKPATARKAFKPTPTQWPKADFIMKGVRLPAPKQAIKKQIKTEWPKAEGILQGVKLPAPKQAKKKVVKAPTQWPKSGTIMSGVKLPAVKKVKKAATPKKVAPKAIKAVSFMAKPPKNNTIFPLEVNREEPIIIGKAKKLNGYVMTVRSNGKSKIVITFRD